MEQRAHCRGPNCTRDVLALGCCRTHWKQHHAGKVLTPIAARLRLGPDALAIRVRLDAQTAKRLDSYRARADPPLSRELAVAKLMAQALR